MKLGPGSTLHYLRNLHNEINDTLTPTQVLVIHIQTPTLFNFLQTHGKHGHKLDIKKMLEYFLTKKPPPNPSKPVQIKFAFNRGTMTSGKKIKQEHGTVQILTGYSLAELKSHNNAHQWLIYLGKEDYDILVEELAGLIEDIMSLLDTMVFLT